MSTNPFRRSSLKASGSSSIADHPISNPVPIPNDSGSSTPSLSVNTKASALSQKHVNFASPPGVPISPVSYPSSSPESTRFSPAFLVDQSVAVASARYDNAYQSSFVQSTPDIGAAETAISQIPENAGADINTISSNPAKEDVDAVRMTLSKFASAPKKSSIARAAEPPLQRNAPAKRQTMDVDSFARLLLTGEPDSNERNQHETQPTSIGRLNSTNASESNSSADTGSTSFRSMFDRKVEAVETSPSSTDSSEDTDAETPSLSAGSITDPTQSKKPPPPPQSRRGRTPKDKQISSTLSGQLAGAVVDPATTSQYAEHNVSGQSRQPLPPPPPPPPPPLNRRRSQNNDTGIKPAQNIQKANLEMTSIAPGTSQRGPPPPPSRRSGSFMERQTSTDLPSTAEEADSVDISTPPSRKASEPRPPLPPARHSSSSKRLSLGTMAPPLPPPRRGRGSSRSSIDDSQRPSFSTLSGTGAVDSTRSSVDLSKSDIDAGRKISKGPNPSEIMAELAALQKEVDEARRSAGK